MTSILEKLSIEYAAGQSSNRRRTSLRENRSSMFSNDHGDDTQSLDDPDERVSACHLHIGQLPPDMMDGTLHALFEPFGEIEGCIVLIDPAKGRSREFGYVGFKHEEAGEAAMAKMNGYEIRGRYLRVRPAGQPVKPDTRCVWVRNVPVLLSCERLLRMFQTLGDVQALDCWDESPRPQLGRTGSYCRQPYQFVFVRYDTISSARAVIAALQGRRVISMWRDLLGDGRPLKLPMVARFGPEDGSSIWKEELMGDILGTWRAPQHDATALAEGELTAPTEDVMDATTTTKDVSIRRANGPSVVDVLRPAALRPSAEPQDLDLKSSKSVPLPIAISPPIDESGKPTLSHGPCDEEMATSSISFIADTSLASSTDWPVMNESKLLPNYSPTDSNYSGLSATGGLWVTRNVLPQYI